jgi:hypothetical protein
MYSSRLCLDVALFPHPNISTSTQVLKCVFHRSSAIRAVWWAARADLPVPKCGARCREQRPQMLGTLGESYCLCVRENDYNQVEMYIIFGQETAQMRLLLAARNARLFDCCCKYVV